MSVPAERLDQPSGAKPRDLGGDLAVAAQETPKKRKIDSFSSQEQQIWNAQEHAAGTARQPAGADPVHRRRSIGVPARPPLGSAAVGWPNTSRASISQPAEALQYLANKGSRIEELEAKLTAAHTENLNLSQQLEQTSSTIHAHVNSLGSVEGERDFLTAQRVQERVDTEQQLLRAEQTIAALSQELKQTETAQAKVEEQAELSRSEMDSQRAEAADVAATYRQQLQLLQDELQLTQHNAQQAEKHSAANAARQHYETSALRQQLKSLEKQLGEVTREAELHNQRRLQAEEKVAALELQEGTSAVVSSDDSILLQNLRDELAAQTADVAAARRVTGHLRNTEVLQEQLHAAHTRAEKAEQSAAQADQLSLQLAELQSRQKMWEQVLQGFPDAQTPESVLSLVDSLHVQAVKSAELLGEKERQLAAQKGELQSAVNELKEAKDALAAQRSKYDQFSSSQPRSERCIELLTKERDSLKQILTMYQEEAPKAAAAGDTPQRAVQAAHLAQLEGTIMDLRAQYQQAQSELASKDSAAENSLAQLTSANQQAAQAERQVQELQKIYENQSKELALLQNRLGKGEFNKTTTRVLHFKRNPEAEAKQKAEQSRCSSLEAENVALKSQLQKLEGQSVEPASIDTAVKEAQIAVLHHRIADMEKSKTRLSQVFRAQVAAFREACYQMFGYQIDVTAEAAAVKPGKAAAVSVYTLKPQHADDDAARFQFRMSPDQELQMMPNQYVHSRLQKEVETFIDRFQSIPAFTANYTMEQFQKQTQC